MDYKKKIEELFKLKIEDHHPFNENNDLINFLDTIVKYNGYVYFSDGFILELIHKNKFKKLPKRFITLEIYNISEKKLFNILKKFWNKDAGKILRHSDQYILPMAKIHIKNMCFDINANLYKENLTICNVLIKYENNKLKLNDKFYNINDCLKLIAKSENLNQFKENIINLFELIKCVGRYNLKIDKDTFESLKNLNDFERDVAFAVNQYIELDTMLTESLNPSIFLILLLKTNNLKLFFYWNYYDKKNINFICNMIDSNIHLLDNYYYKKKLLMVYIRSVCEKGIFDCSGYYIENIIENKICAIEDMFIMMSILYSDIIKKFLKITHKIFCPNHPKDKKFMNIEYLAKQLKKINFTIEDFCNTLAGYGNEKEYKYIFRLNKKTNLYSIKFKVSNKIHPMIEKIIEKSKKLNLYN